MLRHIATIVLFKACCLCLCLCFALVACHCLPLLTTAYHCYRCLGPIAAATVAAVAAVKQQSAKLRRKRQKKQQTQPGPLILKGDDGCIRSRLVVLMPAAATGGLWLSIVFKALQIHFVSGCFQGNANSQGFIRAFAWLLPVAIVLTVIIIVL